MQPIVARYHRGNCMEKNHLVSVAALVVNEAGKVLLVKSPWRGWEYPGGLIEPGETFREALCREVREEAGVEIEILGFIGICKNIERDVVNIDFAARYVSGELTPSDESTEVIWAAADEALELVTFPLTRKRLANMLSGASDVGIFCFRRNGGFSIADDDRWPVGLSERLSKDLAPK